MLGYCNTLCEGSMLPVLITRDPQNPPLVTQVDLAGPTKAALSTVDGGIEGHSIPHCIVSNLTAELENNSRSFMAHDQGRYTATRRAIHTMDVTSADSASLDLNQDLMSRDCGFGYIFVLKLVICFQDEGFHFFVSVIGQVARINLNCE
jgi:hypothetical protein